MRLSIDFETRAVLDLKKTGVYPYAMHEHTDIWCMAWAFEDEEPEIWLPAPGAELPDRIVEHIQSGGEIRAWNAQFERVIWNEVMVKRYGAPPVSMEQWVCTAAEAAAMALPRSLDQCANALGISEQKDSEGYQLMMRMTRPRKVLVDGTPIWWDVEDRKQRLYAYCKQDVRVERAIFPALRRLTPDERKVYLLDQTMNDRGVPVDMALVRAAKDIVTEGVERANLALAQVTGGEVSAVTQVGQLKEWLEGKDIDAPTLRKADVAELLESDLDPAVRNVLELRAEAGRSSVKKLDSMLHVVCPDGRARGLLLYHGASTGRWAGKLIQPHNFTRGDVADIESYIPLVMQGAYDTINVLASPIAVVSSMLRSMLTATPETHDLIAGDYAAIEARAVNWLAGQDDVLENFRAYDAGDESRNPYKLMAVRMGWAKSASEVKKGTPAYQAGKGGELGCGFGMGPKKFKASAWDVYQLSMTDEQSEQAVNAYRTSHPRVVDTWWDVINAAIRATKRPGERIRVGAHKNVTLVVLGSYLYIVLPSGRPLCYARPHVVMEPPPWGGEPREQLRYYGVDPKSRQWGALRTYGGHLVENIVQAVARDIMVAAKFRVQAAGYVPLLSVHDEVVCEVERGRGSVQEFERLLAEQPQWAAGFPVAAEAWRGTRYRK